MTVHFVGAGPGAADLITVRGLRLVRSAAVCLYAGAIVPRELLDDAPADARLVDTANLTLDEIVAEIETAHRRGEDVVRLHSGDTSFYSAIGEQMRRLDALGIDYDITPGVPAFAAAAAALGRELTLPGVGQTVVLTRVSTNSTAMPPGEDLATLGRSRALLVLHLAVRETARIVDELTPHYGPDCPIAVVARASRPDELVARGRLADLTELVRDNGVKAVAVIMIGHVLGDAPGACESHLYSPTRVRDR
ncbi:precorrin-4 C(11)-methyltransferase [Yinghuangia sp. ASG 101]|uniref:precorrin-4 C(11)-methyltransferase n=1 Tax=Yinghuangia sp. ASG 101 TaxID=2896848 RepID=UPI001E29E8E0|nr:precorrin-4 C(11)-methyltransferase [Yinghuangia sp. ASG 101]UGQ10381.1 precorrin-4 C(11)-methyltransferase [Yinghuangia sp. ASG 101]